MVVRSIPLIALALCVNVSPINASPQKIIMLDPAGHTKQTGRQLSTSYERAETFQCAEQLKTLLEKKFSNVRVLLTRTIGEEIVPLQSASFANRLNADFFLRLHFYKEKAEKPKVFVYHLVIDPVTDYARRSVQPFAFIPVHQAHYASINASAAFARALSSYLGSTEYQKSFDCCGVYGLPIKPLIGIKAPAATLELGLQNDTQWQLFVEPLVESIGKILQLDLAPQQPLPQNDAVIITPSMA